MFASVWLFVTITIWYLVLAGEPDRWLTAFAVVLLAVYIIFEMSLYALFVPAESKPNPKHKNALEYLNAKRNQQQNTGPH